MRGALCFLTPVGRPARPAPGALGWFPAVGLLVGGALGGIWWGTAREWAPLVSAGIVVAADLALTGMLHLDGVVDSADGLLPHLSRERRLAVMEEPGAGAFGVCAAVAVLLLRWGSLAATVPSVALLAGLWCASRTWMAGATFLLPYARPGGLASAFVGPGLAARACAVAGMLASLGLLVSWRTVQGPVALAAGTAAAAGVLALGRRRLGGFTGDVLGAAGVVGETVGLLAAAARW
jgi:cobalamin synthase